MITSKIWAANHAPTVKIFPEIYSLFKLSVSDQIIGLLLLDQISNLGRQHIAVSFPLFKAIGQVSVASSSLQLDGIEISIQPKDCISQN